MLPFVMLHPKSQKRLGKTYRLGEIPEARSSFFKYEHKDGNYQYLGINKICMHLIDSSDILYQSGNATAFLIYQISQHLRHSCRVEKI